jgi:hypothetical protein
MVNSGMSFEKERLLHLRDSVMENNERFTGGISDFRGFQGIYVREPENVLSFIRLGLIG